MTQRRPRLTPGLRQGGVTARPKAKERRRPEIKKRIVPKPPKPPQKIKQFGGGEGDKLEKIPEREKIKILGLKPHRRLTAVERLLVAQKNKQAREQREFQKRRKK